MRTASQPAGSGRSRRIGLAAGMAATALIAACAGPATDMSETQMHLHPRAPYGTVSSIDRVDVIQELGGADEIAAGHLQGDDAAAGLDGYSHVGVQLDDGDRGEVDVASTGGLHVGERVRLQGGRLIPAPPPVGGSASSRPPPGVAISSEPRP